MDPNPPREIHAVVIGMPLGTSPGSKRTGKTEPLHEVIGSAFGTSSRRVDTVLAYWSRTESLLDRAKLVPDVIFDLIVLFECSLKKSAARSSRERFGTTLKMQQMRVMGLARTESKEVFKLPEAEAKTEDEEAVERGHPGNEMGYLEQCGNCKLSTMYDLQRLTVNQCWSTELTLDGAVRGLMLVSCMDCHIHLTPSAIQSLHLITLDLCDSVSLYFPAAWQDDDELLSQVSKIRIKVNRCVNCRVVMLPELVESYMEHADDYEPHWQTHWFYVDYKLLESESEASKKSSGLWMPEIEARALKKPTIIWLTSRWAYQSIDIIDYRMPRVY